MTTRSHPGRIRELRIACLEREERRTELWLDLEADGNVGLTLEATGAQAGGWREEHGIDIAVSDLPRLAFALLAEHYAGDLDAIGKVRELARRSGIAIEAWEFENGEWRGE